MKRRPVTVHVPNREKILAEFHSRGDKGRVNAIAAKYNIAPSTLYRWRMEEKHREGMEAIAS